MNALPVVSRMSEQQRLNYLRIMRKSIADQHASISRLIKLYEALDIEKYPLDFGWSVPLSAYSNFRDALCHYAAACHHEEEFQMLQEKNSLEEHLHRATKDLAVHYLQELGRRLENVYLYQPTAENNAFPEGLESVNIDSDILEVIKNLAGEGKWTQIIPFIQAFYVKFLFGEKRTLQKWLHKVRNFDLQTRNASLKIQKPFSGNGLTAFYDMVNDCIKELQEKHMYDTVICLGECFDTTYAFAFEQRIAQLTSGCSKD